MSVRRLAPKELQPANFTFTAENLSWAKEQIAKYPEGRQASAVIPILWRAQEQSGGWLPQKAIEYVADILAMPRMPGLLGVALSGAGPSILALATERFDEIGKTIAGHFEKKGLASTIRHLEAAQEGLTLTQKYSSAK